MNVSISYDKVIDTKKGIAKRAKCKEHDGVFVLWPSINNEPTFFEIDNADLKIDAVDRDRKKTALWKCDYCVPTTTAESNKGANFLSPVLRIPSKEKPWNNFT